MPEIFHQTFYGNTFLSWLIGLSMAFVSLVFSRGLYWFLSSYLTRYTKNTKTDWDDLLLKSIKGPLSFAVGLVGVRLSLGYLDFSDQFELWINRIYHIVFVMNAAWVISRFVDSIFTQFLIPLSRKTESDMDDMVIPFIQKGSRALIWTLGVIIGLNNAGYNVGALLTGLGIGGVAVALAARNTLTNIFGGITVFIDQPFKIGDKIRVRSRVRGIEGKVLDVGLRQTRILTDEGTVVHIPNSMFANDALENISMEESKKVTNFFKLHKKNSAKKVEEAISLLKQIAIDDPDVLEKVIISFVAIEDSFLGVLYIYFINKDKDDNEVLTRMNVKILEEFVIHDIHWAETPGNISSEKYNFD